MTLMKSSFQKGRDSKTGRHNYHVYQIFIGPSKLTVPGLFTSEL